MNPNSNHQRGRDGFIPVPSTTNNSYSPALHYFVTLQNQHITRLRYLFPEINPAALKKLLDLCQGDFIKTVDSILHIRRNHSIQGKHVDTASTSSSVNSTMQYPNALIFSPLNNRNPMSKAPVSMPMVQTSAKMLSDNQTFPSTYHVNQCPVMNNTNVSNNAMLMQPPVFVQRSNSSTLGNNIQNTNKFSNIQPMSLSQRPNLSASGSNIQNPNKFSNIQQMSFAQRPKLSTMGNNMESSNKFPNIQSMSYPTLPNHKTNTSFPASPIQETSTPLPSFEHLKTFLRLPSSHQDVLQLNSSDITDKGSETYRQYLMESPQVTQQIDYSLLAGRNVGEQSKITTNQVAYKATPELFTQQQQESWLQEHQKLYEENQLLELVNSVEPLNTHQLQQDLEQGDDPPKPVFQKIATPSTQTASTVVYIHYQEGTFQHKSKKCLTDPQKQKDNVMLQSNGARTDQNQQCSRSAQKYCSSQNDGHSPTMRVEASVRRKLFYHNQLDDGSHSKDDAGIYEDVHSKSITNKDLPEEKDNAEQTAKDTQAIINISDTDSNINDCVLLRKENNDLNFMDGTPSSSDSCLVIDTDTEEPNNNNETEIGRKETGMVV